MIAERVEVSVNTYPRKPAWAETLLDCTAVTDTLIPPPARGRKLLRVNQVLWDTL